MDIGVDIDGVAVEVAPMIEGTEVEVGREKVVTGAETERDYDVTQRRMEDRRGRY